MNLTREQVKQELIQEPEYARINSLNDYQNSIEYSVSLFMAFKMAFGESKTVQEWDTYTLERDKRKHYQDLAELISEFTN